MELQTFSGHTKSVMSAALSAHATMAVTGSEDNTAKLWDSATGTLIRTLSGHTSAVWSVAFSPDGTKILTGSDDKTAKLWDTETGTLLRTFSGHATGVYSVSFSPDGTVLLTSSGDKTAKMWNVETGALLRTFTGHPSYVQSVAFSPDGTRVLTGAGGSSSDDGNDAKLWDAATGAEIRTFSGHVWAVVSAVFSPDGSKVLTGSYDNTVKLWEAETGALIQTFSGHTASVRSVVFSPDGSKLLAGMGNNLATNGYVAKLWDTETGAEIRTFTGSRGWVLSAVFSPDGTRVLTGSSDHQARLWNTETGECIRTFSGHSLYVTSVAFSPDGTKILTGSWDSLAKVWDVETGARLSTITPLYGSVYAVAFSLDGTQTLIGNSCDPHLYNAATGAYIRTFRTGEANSLTSVAFSRDGTKVLAGSGHPGYLTTLWDAETGEKRRTFDGCAAAFSPDGTKVFTGRQYGELNLLDAASGEVTRTFGGHVSSVTSVAFSPDGTRVASGSWDGTVKLWPSGLAPVTLATVPNVEGLTEAGAVSLITAADLAVGAVTRQCSNTVAAGLVISQAPVAGAAVPLGSAVSLVVSTGLCNVAVPNVAGQTQTAAGTILTGAGLITGGVTQQCDNTVAAGTVISQTPPAGTEAPFGSAVALVVSTGLCSVAVPNVAGQTQTAAETILTGAGLITGGVTQQCSNTVAAGLVISQTPLAGTAAPFGSAVSLVVSTGICNVTVPNVAGQTQTAAGTILAGASLNTGTVTQQCSNTVTAGSVISQDPPAGTGVPFGGAVALVVSTGLCNVIVPNVAGQTQTAAGTTLTGASLNTGVVTEQCNNTVAMGLVISQVPAAGTEAPFGSAVTLVVSTGLCNVTVPNVAGQTQTTAATILTGASLSAGAVTQQCSNTVAAGSVISQTPTAGTAAPFGSVVALVVSTGVCNVAVPDVAGQTQAVAGTTLTGANLGTGAVTQQCSNTVAMGLVISQTPAAGQQATFGGSVDLVISSGPCAVEGEGEGEGEAEGEGEGEDVTPTETELRDLLTGRFEETDVNEDDHVSFQEAQAALPGLTRMVFDLVDTDRDGWISRAEAGLVEEEGCGGCAGRAGCAGCRGCSGGKDVFNSNDFKKIFGDIFLAGLALGVLVLMRGKTGA